MIQSLYEMVIWVGIPLVIWGFILWKDFDWEKIDYVLIPVAVYMVIAFCAVVARAMLREMSRFGFTFTIPNSAYLLTFILGAGLSLAFFIPAVVKNRFVALFLILIVFGLTMVGGLSILTLFHTTSF